MRKKPGPKPHITPRLSVALDQLIMEDTTQAQAARAAGLRPNSLWKALQKPHVKAELESRKTLLFQLNSSTSGYQRLNLVRLAVQQMNTARTNSEKLKTLEFVARVAGL